MSDAATKVDKSKSEWQQQLSPDEYAVTRERGTERAFTGRYWDHLKFEPQKINKT